MNIIFDPIHIASVNQQYDGNRQKNLLALT